MLAFPKISDNFDVGEVMNMGESPFNRLLDSSQGGEDYVGMDDGDDVVDLLTLTSVHNPEAVADVDLDKEGLHLGCRWGVANNLTVFPSVMGGKEKKGGVVVTADTTALRMINWDTDLLNEETRSLVSESHAIFMEMQQKSEQYKDASNAMSEAEFFELLLGFCQRYRACLRLVMSSLEQSSEEIDDNFSIAHKLYSCMFHILHLCEIMFVERSSNEPVVYKLIDWCPVGDNEDLLRQDPVRLGREEDITPLLSEEEDPERYWDYLRKTLVLGRIGDARNMLLRHSSCRLNRQQRVASAAASGTNSVGGRLQAYRNATPASGGANNELDSLSGKVADMLYLLQEMPIMHVTQSRSEFVAVWEVWHEECRSKVAHFEEFENLKEMCLILSGDMDSTLNACDNWQQYFISKLLYQNPMLGRADLSREAHECADVYKRHWEEKCDMGYDEESGQGLLDKISLSIFDLDVFRVLRECSNNLGTWWFVSHLGDLLHHCGHLDALELDYGCDLREFFLLEYASSLFSEDGLWHFGVDYFKHCPAFGVEFAENLLSRVPVLGSEKKARKVMHECAKLGLDKLYRTVAATYGTRMFRMNKLGSALEWYVKAKDFSKVSIIADIMMTKYFESGEFSNLDVLDCLSNSLEEIDEGSEGGSLLGDAFELRNSEALVFLSKFKLFHDLYHNGEYMEAGGAIIELLTLGIAPKKFWVEILFDAVPLLENEEIVFDRSETCELLNCLEELHISHRSKEYLKGFGQPAVSKEQLEGFSGSGRMPSTSTHGHGSGKKGEDERSSIDIIRLALARNLSRAIILEQ
eukprot:Nk52_evm4s299 gene=Nk52_evmTU4s299